MLYFDAVNEIVVVVINELVHVLNSIGEANFPLLRRSLQVNDDQIYYI